MKLYLGSLPPNTNKTELLEYLRSLGVDDIHIKATKKKVNKNYIIIVVDTKRSYDYLLRNTFSFRGTVLKFAPFLTGDQKKANDLVLKEKRVFVNGFKHEATDDELKELFQFFGAVHSAYISPKSRGMLYKYGFVTFFDKETARRVIELGEIQYRGSTLVIKPFVSKRHLKNSPSFQNSSSGDRPFPDPYEGQDEPLIHTASRSNQFVRAESRPPIHPPQRPVLVAGQGLRSMGDLETYNEPELRHFNRTAHKVNSMSGEEPFGRKQQVLEGIDSQAVYKNSSRLRSVLYSKKFKQETQRAKERLQKEPPMGSFELSYVYNNQFREGVNNQLRRNGTLFDASTHTRDDARRIDEALGEGRMSFNLKINHFVSNLKFNHSGSDEDFEESN